MYGLYNYSAVLEERTRRMGYILCCPIGRMGYNYILLSSWKEQDVWAIYSAVLEESTRCMGYHYILLSSWKEQHGLYILLSSRIERNL